jgi:NADPH-dependent curcumin reductase CurA
VVDRIHTVDYFPYAKSYHHHHHHHHADITMTSNPSIIFNQLPTGEPTLETLKYDTSSTIDLDAVLGENEIVLKLVSVSLDPYMRGRMREEHIKSYSPAFSLGKP